MIECGSSFIKFLCFKYNLFKSINQMTLELKLTQVSGTPQVSVSVIISPNTSLLMEVSQDLSDSLSKDSLSSSDAPERTIWSLLSVVRTAAFIQWKVTSSPEEIFGQSLQSTKTGKFGMMKNPTNVKINLFQIKSNISIVSTRGLASWHSKSHIIKGFFTRESFREPTRSLENTYHFTSRELQLTTFTIV